MEVDTTWEGHRVPSASPQKRAALGQCAQGVVSYCLQAERKTSGHPASVGTWTPNQPCLQNKKGMYFNYRWFIIEKIQKNPNFYQQNVISTIIHP